MAANFVAARNFNGRPTLMHKISKQDKDVTLCGYKMEGWSRVYFVKPLDILLCLRCKKFMILTKPKSVSNIIKFPAGRAAGQ